MQQVIRFAVLISAIVQGVTPTLAEDPSDAITTSITFDLTDLVGRLQTLSQNDRREVRAFVFLSTTCPIANSYRQELNRIADSASSGVRLYGVISDRHTTRDEAVRHFEENKHSFPILFDASGLMAELFQPSHVPETLVLNGDGRIVYRGAIDNAYESIGRRRLNVEHHYLEDAMAAVSRGDDPAESSTTPVGCLFSGPSTKTSVDSVSYARDVAPILQSRCLSCHRAGQVAPFALSNYSESVRHAEMIVEVTRRRIMPPWMPGPESHSKFVGDRRLTDRELKILQAWNEAGCPEGNPADLPPMPEFAEGWQLGTPDLIVRMDSPFTVPAGGPDLLQNFVIPLDIAEDKLVAAVEFHPGNKRVVHHAVLFLDENNEARRLDEATPEPGYSNFGGPGFLPSGALGGWSVGNTARRLPNDMGRYLKKGSDLVVQVHYHPNGKQETDQSELGIYFVPKPVAESLKEPAKLVGSIWMANYEMDIAAGESNYRRSTRYTLPKAVILVGIVPHMHLLGKSMTVTATLPNGELRTLIDVPNWNYNWQDEYYLEKPCALPANTILDVSAVFDNSSENPSNPSSPPKRVTWGEQTTDEMLFCFFLMTAEKPEDLIHVIFHNLGHDMKQERASK